MIRLIELFAGIGSQAQALKNAGIDFETVAISEIDKYALQSYEYLHGPVNNLGNISKINSEDVPDCDLITYSFPCQDLSIAGRKLARMRKVGLVLLCSGNVRRLLKLKSLSIC